jgi:hypothetical protein
MGWPLRHEISIAGVFTDNAIVRGAHSASIQAGIVTILLLLLQKLPVGPGFLASSLAMEPVATSPLIWGHSIGMLGEGQAAIGIAVEVGHDRDVTTTTALMAIRHYDPLSAANSFCRRTSSGSKRPEMYPDGTATR